MNKKRQKSHTLSLNRYLSIFLLVLSTSFLGARWNESIYSDPIRVTEKFLETLIDGDMLELNKYMIKSLHNNNHWMNALKSDRKKVFKKWVPQEFRQKRKNFGYVIINTPNGRMAIKFQKIKNKWLWANE